MLLYFAETIINLGANWQVEKFDQRESNRIGGDLAPPILLLVFTGTSKGAIIFSIKSIVIKSRYTQMLIFSFKSLLDT